MNALAEDRPLNVIHSDDYLPQNHFELKNSLIFFKLITVRPAISNLTFDISIVYMFEC